MTTAWEKTRKSKLPESNAREDKAQLYRALFPQLESDPPLWSRLTRRVWGSYWRGECSCRVLWWIACATPMDDDGDGSLTLKLDPRHFAEIMSGRRIEDNRRLSSITDELGIDVYVSDFALRTPTASA